MPVTFAHRAEYAALRGAVTALSALRWRRAATLGGWLGRLGYSPFGVRRRVVERQIAAAFPDWSPAQAARVARASYDHLGRVAVETALMPTLGRQGVLDLVTEVRGWELVERALAQGRGLIFVTGHLGNWELAGAFVAARGVALDVIARRMTNSLFDAYLNRTRSSLGMSVMYDTEAVRRVPRAFREGRAVAFLADQGVLNLASTWVPFFGRPAKTPRGPAVFALRLGVPMIFGTSVRGDDGRYAMHFESVPVGQSTDVEQDVDATVARYTATLERWVRRAPEQYFWQHRRWKWQPPDTPPALRDPTAAASLHR